LPPSKPNDVHVQVEAPFVFRANDPRPDKPPTPNPVPIRQVELSPVRDLPRPASFALPALPPARTKPAHHGVFAKIKGFFSSIFS
jgi:hypothetical protein